MQHKRGLSSFAKKHPVIVFFHLICFCVKQITCDVAFFFNVYLFIYIYLAVLDLCCCVQAFSSCREQELLSSCCVQACHCGGFSCCGAQALGCMGSVILACGLSTLVQ